MIDESFWNEKINQFDIPIFKCPICDMGFVLSEKESSIKKTAARSEIIFDLTSDERDFHGHFVSISKCNNPNCGEIMTIAGQTDLLYAGQFIEDSNENGDYTFQGCKISYTVNYLNPAPNIFVWPINTPNEVIDIIKESFSLFWVDENSCGNKIRTAIEKLLDLEKVERRILTIKGKFIDLTLNQRIQKFESKNQNVANRLLALKWIGNQASHNEFKLNRNELSDAYRILELCLLDLYDETREEIDRLSNEINIKKGIR